MDGARGRIPAWCSNCETQHSQDEMNHNQLYAAINAKLAEIVEASRTTPILSESWKKLDPCSALS